MQDKLSFSIIIPTYNRAAFLEKTINSVLGQAYPCFEIIIVDDGSTDNTEDVVKKINSEKIKYYKIPNSERGSARNFGMAHSQGNYITFLDSDDILYNDYLANAASSITDYQQPPFLHIAYEIRDEKGKLLYVADRLKSDDMTIITKGNPLSCIGIFIRKDITLEYKFNEDRALSGSEDWELWLRIIANYGIKTNNKVSACLFHHNNRSVLQFDERRLVLRKELALKYAFEDSGVRKRFMKDYKKIDAYADSYIALHLALAGENRKCIKYFLQSFKNHPPSVISKRTLAILKHVVFNNFNL